MVRIILFILVFRIEIIITNYKEIVKAICDNREDNKKLVIDMVTNMLKKVV